MIGIGISNPYTNYKQISTSGVINLHYLSTTGEFTLTPTSFITDLIPVLPDTNYEVKYPSRDGYKRIGEYGEDKLFIRRLLSEANEKSYTFTTGVDTHFIRISPDDGNGMMKDLYLTKLDPIKTFTADFVGKVSGSVVENPNTMNWILSETLKAPENMINVPSQINMNNISSLNGVNWATSASSNGQQPQQLFSFNLIEEIERKTGTIIQGDKVQWVKDNVAKLTCNWYGHGTSSVGNKANLQAWYTSVSKWLYPESHTSGSVSKLAVTNNNVSTWLDGNAIVSFLTNAESSDGITPSTINTDYVELIIELK